MIGFDMEWRVSFIKGGGSRKTALIQLCAPEDTCYLFHLSRMSGNYALAYFLHVCVLKESIIIIMLGAKVSC